MQLKFTWIMLCVSMVAVNCVTSLCQMKCNLVYQPVCASDGQTYINACNMKKIACLLSKSIKMVHLGMCTHTDDVSTKQNPKTSTNLIQKEMKLTKLSESKEVRLRKKSRHNQPKKFKHKQDKSWLTHLRNYFLPTTTSVENIWDINKKTFVSRMQNQNKYSPLKVKRFYLIDSKLPTRISHQQTTETCTSTNPTIPEYSTLEYSSKSSTTKNPTTPECTSPESTSKKITTSIPIVPECTALPSTIQSHTTQDINTPECLNETEIHPTIHLTTPECTYPESTTKKIATCIPIVPECTDLPSTTQSHTTQDINTPECSNETEIHPTIHLTTPECTYPESTTKKIATCIPTVPECTDLPSITQSHTIQDINTPECSNETEIHPTIHLTTPECTYPESTTKIITTSIPTVPECTDLPSTTQSYTTQDINTPECSNETETHPTIHLTTPECTYPESTIKESRISTPTAPECTDSPTTLEISTIFSSTVPECSNKISTREEHVVTCPTTPECTKSEPPMTEKELGCNSPHTTIQPDKICNPTTPKCFNQKSTTERHTALHFLNQDCNSPHTTTECKPIIPECTNLETTTERHGIHRYKTTELSTTEAHVSCYPTTTGCNNQQHTTLNQTKLKHTSPQTEVLSSTKPELCLEKSTILRTIKYNKTESKNQRPLAQNFVNRLNFSLPRYFERQKSRFVLTRLKKKQLIRMNKLLESDVNCKLNCTNDKQPVCGSNGITYKNLCYFRKEKCLSKKHIRLVPNDECRDFHSYKRRGNLNHLKFQLNQRTSRKMAQLSKRRRSRFWFRKSKSEIKSFVKTHHKVNNEFHAIEKHQMQRTVKQDCLNPLVKRN